MKTISISRLKKIIHTFEIICIGLLVVLSIFFILTAFGKKDNQSSRRIFLIKDAPMFWKALRHSDESRNEKLTYRLDSDIVLSAADAPEGMDFYGILDGNGHAVTIKANQNSDIMGRSLFNTIHKDAVIEHLKVSLDGVRLSAEDKNSISLFATTNNGTIRDCSVSVGNVEIGACQNTAVLVNFNNGDIFNVCLTVNKVESSVSNKNSWNSVFGAVATVNYGDVESVLLDITFDDSIIVFSQQDINQNIGYVIGGFSEKGKIKNIYLFANNDDDFKYLPRANDAYETDGRQLKYAQKTYSDINGDLQKEIQDKFNLTGEKNGFTMYWSWGNTTEKFPILK